MKSIWIGMMLFFSTVLNAQLYLIEGQVRDLHDNTPLANAKISINGKLITTSDTQGNFNFYYKKGTYHLLVTHLDCESFTRKITLNSNIKINIFLEHHTNEIETVVVHGIHKKSGTAVIKTLEQSFLAQKTTENLGNILSEISGVNSIKTGNNISKPVIQGLYGSRVLVMNNGIKMAEQEWGIEHAPSVDPNTFDHIDVVKGASALKYGGNAIGGVVLLESPKYPKKDTLMGKVALSGISNGKGLALNMDITKTWQNGWALRTQGSAKKLGDLETPHYSLQNTGTDENAFHFSLQKREYEYGITAKYSFINQNFGIYKGAHISNARNFADAINNGQSYFTGNFGYKIENPKQEVSHHIAKLEVYKRLGKLGKFTLEYAFQQNHRFEYDIRRGAYNDKPATDLLLTTQSLALYHLLERPNWQWETGLSGNYQVNFPDPKTERSRLIPDYHRYDTGAFSIFKYQKNLWKWEAALRYDMNFYDVYKYYLNKDWAAYTQAFQQFVIESKGVKTLVRPKLYYHNISASLGMEYQPTRFLTTKLNLIRNSRSPNIAELFADGLHHAAAIIEKGSMSIKNEETYQAHLSIGIKASVLNGFKLNLNPYYFTSDSFINQTPNGVESTIRGNFPVWQYQQIKAKMYGIDIDSELNITPKLQWSGAMSYVYGQDLTHKEPLILMPPMQIKNVLRYDSKDKKPWHIQIENLVVFKQKRFPMRLLSYDVYENNTITKEWLDIGTPPAGYQIWNFNAGAKLTRNIQLNLSVNNIFNTTYREYLNRLRFFSDALGRNIIFTCQFNF
ncbi:TonB-dependent receptor [Riemerella anatipestifer]|nr:TonB-dependent receptor [Riemerella anatipestifer]